MKLGVHGLPLLREPREGLAYRGQRAARGGHGCRGAAAGRSGRGGGRLRTARTCGGSEGRSEPGELVAWRSAGKWIGDAPRAVSSQLVAWRVLMSVVVPPTAAHGRQNALRDSREINAIPLSAQSAPCAGAMETPRLTVTFGVIRSSSCNWVGWRGKVRFNKSRGHIFQSGGKPVPCSAPLVARS